MGSSSLPSSAATAAAATSSLSNSHPSSSNANGIPHSSGPNYADLSTICSVVFGSGSNNNANNRRLPLPVPPQNWFQYPPWSCTMSGGPPGPHHHPIRVRWPSFLTSGGGRSFWTKYCLLCTICGSAATILAGIFLVVAALFRYYTTSIYYFETVPTYIPAILLSICGVSTIAFSCKRNRNIILLRITACWSLVSAALSSVITISTSLIHMNRLQTLKECVYSRNPPSCTCFGHSYGIEGLSTGTEPVHFVFENTSDCDVIHGALYSCLRAVFAISVVAVLLSIFLCMLLYQLIGHERKKAYWSRIRRINSDWSSDFLACLARPLPRDRSSLLPLMIPNPGTGGAVGLPYHWGPPPPYTAEELILVPEDSEIETTAFNPPIRRTTLLATAATINVSDISPGTSASSTTRNLQPLRQSSSSICESNDPCVINSAFSPAITTVLAMPGPSCSNSASGRPMPLPVPLRESKISIDTDSELYSQDEESFSEKQHRVSKSVPTPIVEDITVDYEDINDNDNYDSKLTISSNSKGKGSLPCSPLFLRNTMKRIINLGGREFQSLSCPTTPKRGLRKAIAASGGVLPIFQNLNLNSQNSYQDLSLC